MFLLEQATGNLGFTLLMIGAMVVIFILMRIPQKKQEQRDAAMRDSLAVGDEVTTIGGIIGKVVSIKGETFVLETTRDKTKIRFLKGAIRTVDVKAEDIAAAVVAEENAAKQAEANAEAEEVKDENAEN
jgi:preprotein translocase subunit YajC